MVFQKCTIMPGPFRSASTSVPPGSIGRQSSFPLRQSGADDEARIASKSLSFSSPESGLPGESWASACAHKPSARLNVRRRRVFMVIIPSKLTLWRRIYKVLPIIATEYCGFCWSGTPPGGYAPPQPYAHRSEEHTSELQSL